jgi:hypothetical protein
MKTSSKARNYIWILLGIFLFFSGLYYFLNFVSSGTHGLIAEFDMNENKDNVQIKIDSLILNSQNFEYMSNDFSTYYHIKVIGEGVVFVYKIREINEESCSLIFVYVKNESDNKFRSRKDFNVRERSAYSDLFQNLIIQPIRKL